MTAPPARARPLDRTAPALLHLAVRLLGVAALAVLAAREGTPLLTELTSWDGDWLLAIATGGYDGVPADFRDATGVRDADTPYAFFPGYPLLAGLLVGVLGPDLAGVAVSVAAGVVFAYGLAALAGEVDAGSRRTGPVLVVLAAAAPMAIAYSMAYTEALFCALAVWALVGVLRRRWLLAGALTAAAGLVRPTAAALVAAVVAAALLAAVRDGDGWRAWAGAALAPAGLLGYLGVVAVRTGELTGWSTIQRVGWGTSFDGGVATVTWILGTLTGSEDAFPLLTVATLLASLALLAVAVRARLPWPLLVYAAGVLVTVWGSDGVMLSKMRLLLPAFVLLVPVAVALARRRDGTVVAVLAAAVLASAWLGAHALTVWPYAI